MMARLRVGDRRVVPRSRGSPDTPVGAHRQAWTPEAGASLRYLGVHLMHEFRYTLGGPIDPRARGSRGSSSRRASCQRRPSSRWPAIVERTRSFCTIEFASGRGGPDDLCLGGGMVAHGARRWPGDLRHERPASRAARCFLDDGSSVGRRGTSSRLEPRRPTRKTATFFPTRA